MTDRKQAFRDGLIWSSLGGNNESNIGGNSHLYAYQDDAILVDLGTMFSRGESIDGVKYNSIAPDVTGFLPPKDGASAGGRRPTVKALVVTHGHQDHIGGIGALARRIMDEKLDVQIPTIYATKFTASLIRAEFLDKQIPKDQWPEFRYMNNGRRLEIGKLAITPISGSHSIPGGVSLAIETPTMRHFHSGDIKADQTVPIGPATDFDLISQMRDDGRGFDTMVIDSTRVTSPGETPTMTQIGQNYGEFFDARPDKRAVIGVMATSLEEIVTIGVEAAARDKAIILAGTALDKIRKSAEYGGIKVEDVIQRKLEERGITDKTPQIFSIKDPKAGGLDPRDTIVFATGTQGEGVMAEDEQGMMMAAALPKASMGAHPKLVLDPATDYVINAASIIPSENTKEGEDAARKRFGNEETSNRMLQNLVGMGLEVLVPHGTIKLLEQNKLPTTGLTAAGTHASGHAGQGDLQRYYEAAAPRLIIPVHGSEMHLDKHMDFINGLGLPAQKVGNWAQVALLPGGDTLVVGSTKERWSGIGVTEDPANWRNKTYHFTPLERDPITTELKAVGGAEPPQPKPAAEEAPAAAPAPKRRGMGR